MADERTKVKGDENGHDPCLKERRLLAQTRRLNGEIARLKEEIVDLKEQAKSRDAPTRKLTLSGPDGNSRSGSPAKTWKHSDSNVHKMVSNSSSLGGQFRGHEIFKMLIFR